jgi:hypothetical protein
MPTVAQGKKHEMSVSCSVHPARIDFNLEPGPVTSGEQTVALIYDTAEFQKQLLHIISAIGNGIVSNPISRVALFVQFLTIANDLAEANATVISVVPKRYSVKITPSSYSSNLSERLGHPGPSDSTGV